MRIFPFYLLVLALAFSWSGLVRAAPASLAAELGRQMEVNQQRYGIAGQAVLVAHNGKVLFRGAHGQSDLSSRTAVTTETVFPAYSLAKLFTSTLIMQLVERGDIDLDRPASEYVSGLPAGWSTISVRHFLEHASGVPEYFGNLQGASPFAPTMHAALASLAAKPLNFTPGSATRYTQTNYLVLTALLEARTGKPYARLVHERIVRKLGLRHTWYGKAAVPMQGRASAYVGKEGSLVPLSDVPWPAYSHGHAELYTTIDDLAKFLQALRSGALLGLPTLERLWQRPTLSGGKRGGFAGGWEYGESGGFKHLGHDGGAQVRVRLVFRDTPAGDCYLFIYLSNGSARNVWSRTLLDSVMAAYDPQVFAAEALGEGLIDYALRSASQGDAQAQVDRLRRQATLQGDALERVVNNTGYALRDSLGTAPAMRVFELNTVLFPGSPNAWDSLADTYRAAGAADKAAQLDAKAASLGPPAQP